MGDACMVEEADCCENWEFGSENSQIWMLGDGGYVSLSNSSWPFALFFCMGSQVWLPSSHSYIIKASATICPCRWNIVGFCFGLGLAWSVACISESEFNVPTGKVELNLFGRGDEDLNACKSAKIYIYSNSLRCSAEEVITA